MSTYTDLQNKVKETINVDYHNRTTNQNVKFLNPENVYWGSFKGKVDATNASMTGGTISGVTIVSANLARDIILPGNVDIAKIGSSISYLSTVIDTLEEKHDDDKSELTGLINTERIIRYQNDLSIRSDMMNLSATADSNLSAEKSHRIFWDTQLCTKIDNEITARIAADGVLKSALELSVENLQIVDQTLDATDKRIEGKLDSEIAQRIREINRVDVRIDDLDAVSNDRYLSALSALDEHAKENDEQFENLEIELKTDIAHDKHYVINKEGITAKYPYMMKEFAVNILQTDAASGYIVRNGKTIGKIETASETELYPMVVEIFDFDDVELRTALKPSTFTFTEAGQSFPTNVGRYSIVYRPSGTSLATSKFELIPLNGSYMDVYFNGSVIGEIRNYLKSSDNKSIISGYLTLNPSTPALQPFDVFKNVEFNNTTKLSTQIGTQRVVYNGISEFKLLKNVTTHMYCPLNGLSNEFFGCIYEDGGIISDEIHINRIRAKINDPVSSYVNLDLSNGYVAELCANIIVSCDIENQIFDVVEKHELYKHNFYLSDDIAHVGGAKGYVVPAIENTDITSYGYKHISADVSEIVKIDAFKRTFELEYDKTTDNWRTSVTSTSGDVIDIWFDRQYLYVYAVNNTTGMHVNGKFAVDLANKTIYNVDTCHKHLHTTEHVEFVFNESEEWFDGKYDCYSSLIDKTDDYPIYELNIDADAANTIKIELPTKEFTDISRELKIVLKVNSLVDKQVKIEFVDNLGNPVVFFNNRTNVLYVETNKYTTYQLNEIANGIYHLYDFDINDVWKYIKQLSGEVKDISIELSTDYCDKISSLRDDVELSVANLENEITINASNIQTLSGEVDDIYARIKGGINYKGLVNVIDRECEHGGSNFHISNLFYIDFGSSTEHHDYKKPNPDYVPTTVLSNGYMYIAKKTPDNLSSQWIVDGIQIDAGDVVIINCREGIIPGAECKQISNLTSADVDVIDAQDDNVVTKEVLYAVSSYLSAEITKNDADIEFLSTYCDDLSSITTLSVDNLQSQINSNDSDIDFLSNQIDITNTTLTEKTEYLSDQIDLTNDTMQLSVGNLQTQINNNDSDISFLSANADNLQDQIISNDNDISVLEDKVEFLLSVDRESVNYKGILPNYKPEFDDDPEAWQLYELITPNITTSGLLDVKLGDLFKVNQNLSAIYDYRRTVHTAFGKFDFFIANKNILHVRDITIDDIDIFRNPESEVEDLSVKLQTQITQNKVNIDVLSTELDVTNAVLTEKTEYLSSTLDNLTETVELSVANLQSQINSNDSDISFLSTELDVTNAVLTEKTEYLSDQIDLTNETMQLSVANIQAQIDENDVDISFLSANADDLQDQIIANDNDIDQLSSKQGTISTDLDTLEYHYNRTFTEDTYTEGPDKKVDVLTVVDSQNTNNKFKLIYLSGTMVLENL